MDCERARLDIHAWIDRALEAEAELELKTHLEKCPECRSAAGKLKALGDLLGRVSPPVPSRSLDRRVMESFLAHQASTSVADSGAGAPGRRQADSRIGRRTFGRHPQTRLSGGFWVSRPALVAAGAVVLAFGLFAFFLGWIVAGSQPDQIASVPSREATRVEIEGGPRPEEPANSLSGFQPILEPKIRIVGRQAQQ